MNLRTRLIPVASLVVALGASAAGAAAAATDSKTTPTKPAPTAPRAVKCVIPVTPDGKAKAAKAAKQKAEADWAAVAAKLGTTPDQLQDALKNTKIWMGQQTSPVQTPSAFLQHLADLLHQPVAKVKTVLYEAGVFRDSTDKTVKPDKPVKGKGCELKADKFGKTDQGKA